MAELPASYDTSFSLIDSLVTQIQKSNLISDASDIQKLASIAKFAVDKADRSEKLFKATKEKWEKMEQRYKDAQEEMHRLRRDNDGSVELKEANSVALKEKDGIIQKLREELAESKAEKINLRKTLDAIVGEINAFAKENMDQEQQILELSRAMAEKDKSIKELQEENSRLSLAGETMGPTRSTLPPSNRRIVGPKGLVPRGMGDIFM